MRRRRHSNKKLSRQGDHRFPAVKNSPTFPPALCGIAHHAVVTHSKHTDSRKNEISQYNCAIGRCKTPKTDQRKYHATTLLPEIRVVPNVRITISTFPLKRFPQQFLDTSPIFGELPNFSPTDVRFAPDFPDEWAVTLSTCASISGKVRETSVSRVA